MSINNRLINTGAAGGNLQSLLVLSDTNIKSISIADPSNLSVLDTVPFTGGTSDLFGNIDKDSVNQNAYCVNNQNNILALNYSNPSNLSVISTKSFGANNISAVAVDEENSVAYVVERTQGRFYSINISNPSNMITESNVYTYPYTTSANGLSLSPNKQTLAYASASYYILHTLNVTNPTSITSFGEQSFGQYPYQTRWKNDADLYMVGDTQVYKYTKANNSITKNFENSDSQAFRQTRDMAVNADDNLGYIVSGTYGEGRLTVMSISGNNFSLFDTTNYRITGLGETINSVVFDPTTYLCYVVTQTQVKVVDVSNPVTPTLVSTFTSTDGSTYLKSVVLI